MKVKVDIPEEQRQGKNDYFGLISGNIYEVIYDENDRFIVKGNSDYLNEVMINKKWCTVVPDYNIEIPEELFEI